MSNIFLILGEKLFLVSKASKRDSFGDRDSFGTEILLEIVFFFGVGILLEVYREAHESHHALPPWKV